MITPIIREAIRAANSDDEAPLLVGESNPYNDSDFGALLPWPTNSAGGRLQRVVFGLKPETYLRRFRRTNLWTGEYHAWTARRNAESIPRIYPKARLYVLLGTRVAGAFGHLPWDVDENVVCIPHPSGLSHAYNDRHAVLSARRILTLFLPRVPFGELELS